MSLSAQQQTFVRQMYPYAVKAEKATNVPAQVILAQWITESAAGTSSVFQRTGNLAGIRRNGEYVSYDTMDAAVNDWIKVINLSYYDKVRSAGSVQGATSALIASPWDAGHYGGQGQSLIPVVNNVGEYLSNHIGLRLVDPSQYQGGLANRQATAGASVGAGANSIGTNISGVDQQVRDQTLIENITQPITGAIAESTTGLITVGVIAIALVIAVVILVRAIGGGGIVKKVVEKGAEKIAANK